MNRQAGTRQRMRASDLPCILPSDAKLKRQVQQLVQIYVFALMIRGYSKHLTKIAVVFGVTVSSLSRMLSNPLLGPDLHIALNRRVRQVIAGYISAHSGVTVEIIIDATLVERSSRKAENVGLYHSNGRKVWGHRITNVGLLLDGALYLPLASIAHHTRPYARSRGLSYLTEGMMVRGWLRSHMKGLVELLKTAAVMPKDITFLLDAGYDNAEIQRDIRKTGCHFVMMLKNTRTVGGFQVKKFFTRNRHLAWDSVYFNRTANGKNKRRKFRIRTAENVKLAHVGQVNAVCSEKVGGRRNSRKTNTRRFLATSRLDLSGRDILELYSRRWAIETWHKKIKQDYGFNDCSASKFESVENHLNLCLMAYICHMQGLKTLPSHGTTIEEYLQYSVRKKTRTTMRLINGKERFEEELCAYQSEIFAQAS